MTSKVLLNSINVSSFSSSKESILPLLVRERGGGRGGGGGGGGGGEGGGEWGRCEGGREGGSERQIGSVMLVYTTILMWMAIHN